MGIHAGIKDPRLTIAAQVATRMDVLESADTLTATIPTERDRTGRVVSAYVIARPLAFVQRKPTSPLLTLLRIDHVKPDVDANATAMQTIGGVGYQLNARAQVWLDYHNTDPKNGSTIADSKTFFVRGIIAY
jgi:hypothetical protein